MSMHRNILVVDDDQDMIDLVTLFLEKAGFAVAAAKDGYSALEQVNNHYFDLVVLDKSMPFVNGDQVLKSIRNNQMTKDLPIIMLTANTDLTDVKKSKDLGVDDYVLKPPKKENFITRIEKLLGKKAPPIGFTFDDESGVKLGQISPPLTLLSINVGGIILKSPSASKKDASIESTHIKLFEMLDLDFKRLKISCCEPRSDGNFDVFISFLPLSKVDTAKIRDWIVTKSIVKNKKS